MLVIPLVIITGYSVENLIESNSKKKNYRKGISPRTIFYSIHNRSRNSTWSLQRYSYRMDTHNKHYWGMLIAPHSILEIQTNCFTLNDHIKLNNYNISIAIEATV